MQGQYLVKYQRKNIDYTHITNVDCEIGTTSLRTKINIQSEIAKERYIDDFLEIELLEVYKLD